MIVSIFCFIDSRVSLFFFRGPCRGKGSKGRQQKTPSLISFSFFGSGPSVLFSTLVVIFPACVRRPAASIALEQGNFLLCGAEYADHLLREEVGVCRFGPSPSCVHFSCPFNSTSIHPRAGFSLSFELFLVGRGSDSPKNTSAKGRDGVVGAGHSSSGRTEKMLGFSFFSFRRKHFFHPVHKHNFLNKPKNR
ncbi:hypothetical protein LZ30DRAFT_461005 [Colletotrichum cereale]|nr:hypothetical protein LZ30DRAFT_461005 [Colletotrichum cereale]